MAKQITKPISPSEMDRKLLLDTLDNMDVVKSGGKVVQGLVNRRSREKDNAEDINPAFPAEVSEDADLSQIQKRAALNLLIREESSGGQNLGLETEGNTVGRYHIKQDKAALVNPEIKDMTTSEYHRYIINNPDAEEQIVSKYIDIEIDKMLKNSGVDKSRLRHNEYASIVSNLYNKGNQPKLLKSASKLTGFRKDNSRDKRFTEKPYFEELKGRNQNLNQSKPIADTGADLPPDTQNNFPLERVIDIPAEENKYEGIPFLRYKPIQKLLGLAEGGVVPMKKQMEMFQEGGLRDEGGTVDPISGNEVPPGSTQEEVRDDIPAQLSEGEFVFPADVVRYIGLGNLMQMRQEAKMGLKMMEEMGQMGNSEEATIPDDVPFNLDDLELDDEPREMQIGGFVQPTTAATQQQQQMGISGFQQAAAPTTGVAPIPQAASQQFVQPMRPQQAAVPTMQQYKPQEVPSFTQLVGENPGQYDELREYRNEAGMVRMIPFKAGQPIYPIPEGFTFVDPEATQTEEVTTTPTTPQTTSVRADASRDERQEERARKEEEMYGPGGGRLGIKGDIYGVSFDGINPLTEGKGLLGNLITGGMIPADLVDKISVNLQNPEYGKFTVTGQEYNEVKQSIDEFGANSERTKDLMNKLRLDAKTREAQRAAAEAKKEEERVTAASIIKGDDKDSSDKGESYDVSKKGAALEASLKSSPTPGGKGVGRQDYSGGGNRPDSKSEEKSSSSKSSSSGSSGSSKSSGGGNSYSGGFDEGPGGYKQGGLASKPKPKVKKMKRGGLASKK